MATKTYCDRCGKEGSVVKLSLTTSVNPSSEHAERIIDLILLLAVYGIVYAGLHLVCALVDAWEDLVLTWKAR